MGFRRAMHASTVIAALLAVSSAPAFAAQLFEPENAKVTGTGGEAKFFSNQIVCEKSKFTGQVLKVLGISKIEGAAQFEGCSFGKRKVKDFTSLSFSLNATESVSIRQTLIEVEGGCVVTTLPVGENLLMKKVNYENGAMKKITSNIKVPGTETGLLYKTDGSELCGTLKEHEEVPTAFTGTMTITGAEYIVK